MICQPSLVAVFDTVTTCSLLILVAGHYYWVPHNKSAIIVSRRIIISNFWFKNSKLQFISFNFEFFCQKYVLVFYLLSNYCNSLHLCVRLSLSTRLRWWRILHLDCWQVLKNMGTSLQPCLLCIGLLSILGFSVRFYSLFLRLLMCSLQLILLVLFALSDALVKISYMFQGHTLSKMELLEVLTLQ